VSYLRGGIPQGLLQGVQKEVGYVNQPAPFASQYQKDIGYLRETPGKGAYEQAIMTQSGENAEQQYEAAKQRVMMDASRRGLDPSSGVIQEELTKLDADKAAHQAETGRQLAMWQTGEQRSRLQEARGLEQGLDQNTLYRMSVGNQLMQGLDQMEMARRQQARGVESDYDQAQRSRLMDLNSMLQPPSYAGASVAGSQAWQDYQRQAQESAGLGSAMGGLSQAAIMQRVMENPQLYGLLPPARQYNPYAPQYTAPPVQPDYSYQSPQPTQPWQDWQTVR
jgi:hypothetical protein